MCIILKPLDQFSTSLEFKNGLESHKKQQIINMHGDY